MIDDEVVVHAALTIRRTRYQEPSGAVSYAYLGDDWRWSWGICSTLRALTTPGSDAAVPALPEPRDPHEQSLGYWAALEYLLHYRLGWSRPHLGLYRWIGSGRHSSDVTLRFIDAVWGCDDGLNTYYAWSLREQTTQDFRTGFPTFAPKDPALSRKSQLLAAKQVAGRFPYFNASDSDPLHLGGHLHQAPGPTPGARLLRTDPDRQRAILLSADMRWYQALLNLSSDLPMRGVHSWKVEVHVDSVGFIGTFRRSAETGLWFTGSHSTHMMGNA